MILAVMVPLAIVPAGVISFCLVMDEWGVILQLCSSCNPQPPPQNCPRKIFLTLLGYRKQKLVRLVIQLVYAFATFRALQERLLLSLEDCRILSEAIVAEFVLLLLTTKMFFHIVLERNLQLHPRYFGPHLRDKLVSKLIQDVEGTCSGRYGFVVAITGVEHIGKGLIREGTGYVTFPVKYQCVIFRPFKGEILEAAVTMVNKMGFFAEAGPVQIFVSNHLIPDDMEFQTGDAPSYTTSDGSVRIQRDTEVRLKIVGTRVDATEIFCIGTIKEDYLGVISDPNIAG